MSLDVTKIVEQYNGYYLNSGQNQEDILRSFKRQRTLPTFAQSRMTKNTTAQLSNVTLTSVLQPFHKTYSGKGDTALKPNEIQLRKLKVDLPIDPDDVEETWAGFLADPANADRAQWPLVRYIWEVLVAEQAQQDYEAADWAGQYSAAPGGGTPGSHLAVYNGLKKLAVDGLANTDLPMHLLHLQEDPTDPTKVFDNIENIAGQLPPFWANRQVDILVPQKMYTNYFRDRRNKHGNDWGRDNQLGTTTMLQPMSLDGFPNWRLVPFGGMDMAGDYGHIIATPRANVLHYTQTGSWRMGMTTYTRTVKLFADWFEGVGFGVNDMVYVFQGQYS